MRYAHLSPHVVRDAVQLLDGVNVIPVGHRWATEPKNDLTV
jgi:hypothetical protein